ncbi:hypothetical protein [Methanoregula sp.]|uniref:hypothetical protein n=1 Tax=Methanoregula sp. TaxID=2052170 RepID=UPI003566439F
MEVSAANHGAVARSDVIASGAAGTGEELERAAASLPVCSRGKSPKRRDRIVIGLGVLSPGAGAGSAMPETPAQVPVAPADDGSRVEEGSIDLIFALYERDERIAERLERKISRLEKRMDAIGKRGRS